MAADLLSFVDFCCFFIPWAHLPRSACVAKVLKFVQLFLPQDSAGTTKRSISTCMEMHQRKTHPWAQKCRRKNTTILSVELVWSSRVVSRGLHLPGTFIEKSVQFFTLLSKLVAKPSCLHSSTMASADYHSGIPLLPTTPSPWQKLQWMVVADCCMPRRWVGGTRVALGWRRPSWLKSVSSAHFVRVFCVLLYVETITIFA